MDVKATAAAAAAAEGLVTSAAQRRHEMLAVCDTIHDKRMNMLIS